MLVPISIQDGDRTVGVPVTIIRTPEDHFREVRRSLDFRHKALEETERGFEVLLAGVHRLLETSLHRHV